MFFVSFERGPKAWKHEIDPEAILQKLAPIAAPDKKGFLARDRAFLVQAVHWNTSSSLLEPAPLDHAASANMVVSWARIDNGEDLIRSLGLPPSSLTELSDSDLILQSYLKWGESCVNHLVGDFAFAIYDTRNEKVFCARDHMGVRPFYYFLSPERFVCATSLAALTQPVWMNAKPDEQWICEYLCQLSMSWDRTPYQGIRKLPPAHSLSVGTKGHHLTRYFQLSAITELKLKNSRDYVEAYREHLKTAVKCRLQTDYPLGIELSGGLDSSSIAGFAARLFNRPLTNIHAFSHVVFDQDLHYMEEARQAFQLPDLHVIKGSNFYPDYRNANLILGHPIEKAIPVNYEPFYFEAEKLNIRTLLSGFGGDEFATTIFSYLVPVELIAKRRYKELFRVLPGNAPLRFLRLIKRQIKELITHFQSAPDHHPVFLAAYKGRLPHLLLRQTFMDQYRLAERYLEQAVFDTGYNDFKQFTLDQCWSPLIPTRMQECMLIAASRKIEYRWPLLDIRLVRFFMSVPSEEHYFRGMSRFLHRRAVADIVPGSIAWKPSKNMGDISFTKQMQSIPEMFKLENLHPETTRWIDVQKLKQQIAKAPLSAPKDEKSWQIRRNLHAVKNLDLWMKQVS